MLDALPGPVVLVLDDFHLIDAPAVLEQVDALLRYAPATLRLVISTHADPALSALPPLRVGGRLTEVRASDLAFSADAAATLCAASRSPCPTVTC
ncbi:MAG TPA: hypothetical protein VK891_04495 [Euzebyales bacterium]|nr:hypothetical protein [Euzebyales bacterium]